MRIIRNSLWVMKQVFRYAPVLALLNLFFEISVAMFRPLQIIITQRLVDWANVYIETKTNLNELVFWGMSLVVVLILWVTFQKIEGYIVTVKMKKKLVTKYSPEVLDKLAGLPYSFFEDEASNDTLDRISKDPTEMLRMCYSRINLTFFALVSISATVLLMFTYSVWLGLGILALAAPMSLLINYSSMVSHKTWEENTIYRRRETDLRNLAADKHAVYETSVFGSERYIENKWYSYQTKLYDSIKSAELKRCAVDGLYYVLDIIYIIFAGGLTIAAFLNGAFTLGQLAAMFDGMHGIIVKLNRSARFVTEMISYSARCEQLRKFMVQQVMPVSHENADGFDIVFSHVYFTYPNTDREILHDMNIKIKQGERIAFVGENGSGKSTIIKLLCGLYPVTHGRILVGGRDINTLSEKSRHEFISVLFQDFQTYNMTVRENTAIGGIDKINDDNAINEALINAGFKADDIPGDRGIDTVLGKLSDDGVDLSRGQWQRLAMSRAFISDAAFVALDEPTAALDPIAESKMYEGFSRIFKDRGAIMISHRLASAKIADRIFVLDGGRIIEEGSHEKLMKAGGLYSKMFERQASWYKEGER